MAESSSDDMIPGPSGAASNVVFSDSEPMEVSTSEDETETTKKSPTTIKEYKEVIRRIARARGFHFDFQDQNGTVPFSKFILSLLDEPARLPNGTVFFINKPTFSIVMAHDGKFVQFCAYYRCFDFAVAKTFETSLCHFPQGPPKEHSQYGMFAILSFMKKEKLPFNNDGWKKMLKMVKAKKIQETFGHLTVTVSFGAKDKDLWISLGGTFRRVMCQKPFCGRIGGRGSGICTNH